MNDRFFTSRINGSDLVISLSTRASRQLTNIHKPLRAEMQTHLGCMPRKLVSISVSGPRVEDTRVTDRLYINYRSLIGGEACMINADEPAPGYDS